MKKLFLSVPIFLKNFCINMSQDRLSCISMEAPIWHLSLQQKKIPLSLMHGASKVTLMKVF